MSGFDWVPPWSITNGKKSLGKISMQTAVNECDIPIRAPEYGGLSETLTLGLSPSERVQTCKLGFVDILHEHLCMPR